MKFSHILIVVIVLYGLIGDVYFRDFFHTTGIIIGILFFLFLIIYHQLDHRGYFLPGKQKKNDKEG